MAGVSVSDTIGAVCGLVVLALGIWYFVDERNHQLNETGMFRLFGCMGITLVLGLIFLIAKIVDFLL